MNDNFLLEDDETVILPNEEPSKKEEELIKRDVFIIDSLYSARGLKEYTVREIGTLNMFKVKASKMTSWRKLVNEKDLKEIK